MDELDKYRNIKTNLLSEQKIVLVFLEVLSGRKKSFPSGTWLKKMNIIIVVRFLVEQKLKLNKKEIPKVSRQVLCDNKLLGILNRFSSIRMLIMFVYKDCYNETDFGRVSKGYWSINENIKKHFEKCMQRYGYTKENVIKNITMELILEWGMSNALKRNGNSLFKLINAIYPGEYTVFDFKSVPQGFWDNAENARKRIFEMIETEDISFHEIPTKVTQELLIRYHFGTLLKRHKGSSSQLICSLFPADFSKAQFRKTNRYWKDIQNVRTTINSLLKDHNIPHQDIPKYFTKAFFQEQGLYGLIQEFNASPIELVNKLYPGQFEVTEFQRVPNRYWYSKENRIQALRTFCVKRNIYRENIPNLTRSYFRKVFPRFISLVDRHYDSKFHLWIIESFPEYSFSPEEFRLHVGVDGQLCDSMEELQIHNFLLEWLKDAEVTREKTKFINSVSGEGYYPDWIIELQEQSIIVEYFGLFHSDKYKGYKEKSERKMQYFQNLKGYKFLPIFPEDIKNIGYESIKNKFKSLL
ncbi:hypothetical protein FIU87_18515 [Bacillus sp. THAF10]|uniref:hypothetical protein n=1 Tax=Bacillus sp. THAF10 TaxID=2587848 RepID=UPI001267EC74|nr:hypothetical protein [Bacillus sp. THAF10]QFT90642.1 hypothetical protein FIU87_18515 [Bacillus sp. THAF10]